METKLDLILKELHNLKLRVELENKNESSRDDIGDRIKVNTNGRRDDKNDIIRRIKIDPPRFDDILDPKIFSDEIAYLDYYFDWYKFTKESRIQLVRIRLTGSARIYWTLVERVH